MIGDVTVGQPWAGATPGAAKNGAVYTMLMATGEKSDRLVGAASPVAERVQLHTDIIENGIVRMRRGHAIEVEPGSPTVLEPGGLHIMLMGLKQRLVEGDRFPTTLEFERVGSLVVEVVIQGVGSLSHSEERSHVGHDHMMNSESPTAPRSSCSSSASASFDGYVCSWLGGEVRTKSPVRPLYPGKPTFERHRPLCPRFRRLHLRERT